MNNAGHKMENLNLVVIRFLAVIGICMVSNASWAAISCAFTSGSQTINSVMPILKSQFTVGRDVPIGTVIYRQKRNNSLYSQMYCKDTGNFQTKRYYASNTKAKANWTGQPFPNAVYETGLPGIGFAYVWRGNPLNYDVDIYSSNQGWDYTTFLDLDIYFIKIGPVIPGNINLSTFPSAIVAAEWVNGKLNISNLSLSGNMQIVSKTCTTPDVYVDLGSNSIEPLVAGSQTETTRKSFNVIMRDCPVFYGIGLVADNNVPTWDAIWTNQPTGINNNIKISFTPKNGVLDSNSMIAKLDSVQPGNAPAAQGMGIALYHSGGTRYKFDGTFVAEQTPAIGSSGDITYPLEASYTFDSSKPKSAMKPGSGNSSIEFTIQYH